MLIVVYNVFTTYFVKYNKVSTKISSTKNVIFNLEIFPNISIPDSQRKDDQHVIACDGEILIIGRNLFLLVSHIHFHERNNVST